AAAASFRLKPEATRARPPFRAAEFPADAETLSPRVLAGTAGNCVADSETPSNHDSPFDCARAAPVGLARQSREAPPARVPPPAPHLGGWRRNRGRPPPPTRPLADTHLRGPA